MGTIAPTVSEPYPEPRTFWPAAIGGVVFASFCFHFSVGWYWWAPGMVAFLLVALRISNQATIDYDQRKVCEQSRLFGRRVVGTREFPFADFDAIVYQRCQREDEDSTWVGLRLRSGRCIWMRRFSNGGERRGRAAEGFAWRLSCDTGIEIDEKAG
jgi:hypothetical protein